MTAARFTKYGGTDLKHNGVRTPYRIKLIVRFLIPTLQQDPFLKQFCLEDMYSCSSDYLWYPYYPEYHDYCYQNVISRDNTRLSPADNINWLGCIIASSGVNLNIRFDPDERLNLNLSV